MDSKYSLIGKTSANNSPPVILNGFSMKRKFSNMTINNNNNTNNTNEQNSKKSKFNLNSKNGNANNSENNHRTNDKNYNAFTNTQFIHEQRKSLPAFNVRTHILAELNSTETCIIIGETGSGKTTQIPQYLYEDGLTFHGIIAITQPRRVAAITISKRVAAEKNCKIGDIVGYTVRFDDTTSSDTQIKYMTDGSLLREALNDRLLLKYRCVILDEAHERTTNTDILFGIVKEAQKQRSDMNIMSLKIIIMSATMDVDHFSTYFNNCKVIYLEGRSFPVTILHTKFVESDYLKACLVTLLEIHQNAPPNHDVLMFLTGQEEIEGMVQQIRALTKSNEIKGPPIRVFPLYSQLPQNRQLDVFMPTANGTRKVIVSTNIAETSLTITGIKYVIDSGVVKKREYNPSTGMENLKIGKISQAQAWQRTGRAGRDSDGICYRTYTKWDFKQMNVATKPEILRTNITTTVLQLLALEIDCKKFDFMDAPKPDSINIALKDLYLLGAIKSQSSNEGLTEIGKNMAKFPLDPRYSKMLLMAPDYGCLDEMLSIIAVLSGDNIFHSSFDNEKRLEAFTAHSKFHSEYGDHITMLNVFRAFDEIEKVKLWCHENYLNSRNLFYAKEVRNQLSEICQKLGMTSSSCGTNYDQVRKCLLTGLFNNVAELLYTNVYLTNIGRYRTKIHASSVLANKPAAPFVIFTDLLETPGYIIRTITTIESEWIDEIVPHCKFIRAGYK